MRILITGANGYIGKSLHEALRGKHDVLTLTRGVADLTNSQEVSYYFNQQLFFDVVIHTAVIGGSRLAVDSWKVLDQNLQMYYNLLTNRKKFGKLIHFGSGAEFATPESPYGLSKRVIAKSISAIDNFYSLRIYGVFDENELNTRFIKANVLRYINKSPINIIQNKYMDFIYMQDLIKIVEHYLQEEILLKSIDCTYKESKTLLDIAEIINNLDSHKVDIEVENSEIGSGYVGFNKTLALEYAGLEQGIINTYNKLK